MKTKSLLLCAVSLALAGCATHQAARTVNAELTGAWRAKVQFSGGAYASIKDLDFLYAFSAGGTMTESSNYDGAPPVPPAYGVWRRVGPQEFEAKYVFYSTKPPAKFEDIAGGGGWLPSGHGVLTERILVTADGQHFKSKIRYEAFDSAGKPAEGGGEAEGMGERIAF